MQRDSKEALSKATIWWHWVVGVAVIGMLAVGVYMDATHTYALYPWHKSFGVLLFFLILPRVLRRMVAGWPPPVREYPTAERLLASVVHYLLLIGILLMPISGFLMSAVGGSGVEVFGLEVVARNPDPNNPSETVAHNETVASIAHQLHGLVGYTLIAAVFLHTVGALKHHIIDKDGTLRRMLGKAVRG